MMMTAAAGGGLGEQRVQRTEGSACSAWDFHQNGCAIFLEGLCCDALAVRRLLVLTSRVDGRLTAAAY